MKSKNKSNSSSNPGRTSGGAVKSPLQNSLVFGACVLGAALGAQRAAGQVGDVFYIEMENHDFTQPSSYTSIQPILGNTAAPFQNSLVTPGNANAAQTSYATAYYNTGNGVHPSEPNYVWAEAGSNLGTLSDNDPSVANRNIFTPGVTTYNGSATGSGTNPGYNNGGTAVQTLTGQMDAAGVSWKNYQEDIQYTSRAGVSASGTGGTANGVTVTANPYNGSTQYNYAAKHNPMAFFTDSASKNLYQMSQLQTDLNNSTVGRYNWITPDQYNDAHTALTGGFTYNGVHYTGDQAAVAQGDNYLATIIPEIEASAAYKNNGVIIIGYDESEGGDTTATTIPEIVISPLAKGNAYASSVAMSHTSDLETMEEIFGLSYLNNQIPTAATSAVGGYNADGTVNDLSSLFQANEIPTSPVPEAPSSLMAGGVALLCAFNTVRRKMFASKTNA